MNQNHRKILHRQRQLQLLRHRPPLRRQLRLLQLHQRLQQHYRASRLEQQHPQVRKADQMALEVHCHHRLHQCLASHLDLLEQLLDQQVLKELAEQLVRLAQQVLPVAEASQV
jgi:hypothetical protein